MQQEPGDSPPTKRRKLSVDLPKQEVAETQLQASPAKGLERPISPPPLRRPSPDLIISFTPTWNFDGVPERTSVSSTATNEKVAKDKDHVVETRLVPSLVQLTRIEGLPQEQNVDAVSLGALLGDPLIKECWNFNYLFDLDFVMQHFDGDVRDMVKVKIVHGFWRREDDNRLALLQAAERYPNIELLSAYVPDLFGTHHSKMLILFRHDDTAQVIIHTANMIQRDWSNMTQAVWASPPLPLLSQTSSSQPDSTTAHPVGSGERFKVDLLRYIRAYGKRFEILPTQLEDYDFSSIRAAFLGSAPSRQKPEAVDSASTAFGWLGLGQILSSIPVSKPKDDSSPHIITQISSVATLGPRPAWLHHFQSILSRCSSTKVAEENPSSFTKRNDNTTTTSTVGAPPKFSIIFPTPSEIRSSLDGYVSGASIHWKLQSAQQQKQIEYMHPLLHHWTHASTSTSQRKAHRGPAAPHIKTYIRFRDQDYTAIDWAMVTSANLSKQAWGDVVNKKGEIWIQSWETGVVVWPALFADSEKAAQRVEMVPAFGTDTPDGSGLDSAIETIVGFRMPYDVPLVPYAADERPWCSALSYFEPDRHGRRYMR